MTWGETKRDRRLREAGKLMNDAAASLRRRTGQAIAAGGRDGDTVPPRSRYAMASLLEALAHEVARGRVSDWTITEAEKLARSIVAEDDQPAE